MCVIPEKKQRQTAFFRVFEVLGTENEKPL
jgi:hypothetical protein